MSKIARIYQGLEEIQKYYQGGVLQRLFFDWKHYIGNELNIEYAKECAGRNVVISGKTYQNLVSNLSDLVGKVYTLNNNAKVISNLLRASTTYTFIFNISEANYSYTDFGAIMVIKYPTLSTNYVNISKKNGIFKVRYTTREEIPKSISISPHANNDTSSSFKLDNLIILEGDYTKVDLPNSINGIESIGEKEGNLVTIRNYNYKCGTDNIILPNGVKNSIDTIDGKKVHVQRVWKRVFDGSDDEKWRNGYGSGDGKNNRFEMEIISEGSYSNTYMNLNTVASVCSHFKYETTNSIPKSFGHYRISFNNSMGKIYLLFNIDTNIVPLEDISAWRAWLSENPVTVWYELATPIYTYLESGLYDEITIPTSGIKNEIYSENGKWYHKRNIGKAIFDDSSDEEWYYEEAFKRFNSPYINDCTYKNGRTPVCIKGYTYNETPGVNFDTLAFLSGAYKGCKLYICNYAYTSVKDFRAYLAENPLEVYYELAEPVISELPFSDITYKLNEPLRSLPDGTCDTIEGNKLIQRVGKVVLGGDTTSFTYTLDTQNSLTTTVRFYIILSSSIFNCVDSDINSNNIFMTNFPLRNGAHGDYEYISVQVMSASEVYKIFLSINRAKLESVNVGGLKKWLEQTPITVYYPLATPIETEITPDMILINGEPITDTVGIELPDELATPVKIPLFSIKEGLTTLKSTNNITPQMELDCLVRDGFQNMCDNVWEAGFINLNTGVNEGSMSTIRLINDIQVKPNTTYRIDITNLVQGNNGDIAVRYYDISKTYISGGLIGNIKSPTYTFTTSANCYYIRFVAVTTDTNFKIYLKEVIN